MSDLSLNRFLSSEIKGPRPMALHLSNAMTIWREASAGAQRLEQGEGLWHPDVAGDVAVLAGCLPEQEDWAQFCARVSEKATMRADQVLKGISQYLAHPYKRPASNAITSLVIGTSTLLDFGGTGQPVLVVPSLINPCYVLDLMPGRSFTGYLKSRGYRPFLVNWGDPGTDELGFGASDYIMQRLVPLLRHVRAIASSPVPLIGYCMGGTLATALAARAPEDIAGLVLIASPWDFATKTPHAGRRYAGVMAEALHRLPEGMPVPVDMLQVFFTSVDPTLTDRKFRRFATMDMGSEAAAFFVALETWANTGAPLARKVAAECLEGWYLLNETGQGCWQVGGAPVRLSDIHCPVWIAAPAQDRLVPQESAFAMLKEVKQAVSHDPDAGHIGMMVGSKAEQGLWVPLCNWLDLQKGGLRAA